MLFFPLIPLQEMILAFFLGLGLFILLYVAWTGYPQRPLAGSGKDGQPLQSPEPKDVPQGEDNPIPPFLVLVYAGVTIWILAYLIFVGLSGEAIG
jgi:hypothetical protein